MTPIDFILLTVWLTVLVVIAYAPGRWFTWVVSFQVRKDQFVDWFINGSKR